MNTTFSYGVRMLMCTNCGAPLQVAPTGGSFPCQYCGTVNQVATRDERALVDVAHRPPVNEVERMQRLRAQDGKPLLPPPALQGLFGPGGEIPPHRMQETLAVWQSSRNELRTTGSYEAAERLLFLTMALSNVFSQAKDLVRQRAMFESAFEAFTLPRHRQMMLGFLSRNAAKMGDLASAERWLSMCDPQPEDLESDSAFRMSFAFIATARQDWNRVLQTLGPNNTDVPIMDAYDILAAILRANAWERAGQLQGAVVVLQETMQKCGAQGRMVIEQILRANAEWNWCAASFPAANAAHASQAGQHAAASQGGGVGTFLVGLGVLMLLGAVGAVVAGSSGAGVMGYSWAIGPGIAGVVMLMIGLPMRASGKRAARLRLHGRSGTGTVVGIESTGMRINNVPQVLIHLQVQVEGLPPYQASTKLLLSPMSAARLQPGAAVPVRVDPANPGDLIIETD